MAKSYAISGSGLAMANTIGSLAMLLIMSWDRILALDNPTKTSAFFKASSKVFVLVSLTKNCLYSSRSVLSLFKVPLLSSMIKFSFLTPRAINNLLQLIALAPAPFTTIFISDIDLFTTSSAFNNAAPLIIAVPCWSSCMIGIFNSSLSLLSISKHSGALMSSRFIPPKVGSIAFTH